MMMAMEGLSQRQQDILRVISQHIRDTGYPPTVREIGQRVGLRSSCTVHRHLRALQRKGYLTRQGSKNRALGIVRGIDASTTPTRVRNVPLVGRIAAGQPLLAEQNVEGVYAVSGDLLPEGDCFMLQVHGDSMIGAGIHDGDFVVVRQQASADNGDIVAALIGDEATVKRLYREERRIRLQPDNPVLDPLFVDEAQILGRAILVIRRL